MRDCVCLRVYVIVFVFIFVCECHVCVYVCVVRVCVRTYKHLNACKTCVLPFTANIIFEFEMFSGVLVFEHLWLHTCVRASMYVYECGVRNTCSVYLPMSLPTLYMCAFVK